MSSSQSSRSGNDAGSTGKIMLRTLGCFYVEAGQKVETRLRKQNAPQEGGSLRRPGANLNVSASFRAYPFLSERHKRDSLQSGERFARDVVRRRCPRTTHDMDDLRGQTVGGLLCRAPDVSQPFEHKARFHGFHTSISEVGNVKTPDGTGVFTDFTDFTPSQMGVYVPSAHTPARPRTRRHTHTTFKKCEIRETREIARRQAGNLAVFTGRGVKGVKSPVGNEMEATQ